MTNAAILSLRFRSPRFPSPFRFLLLLVLLLAAGATLGGQARPVYSRGTAGILQQIGKLQTTASVLLIGAHPDDEDSAFIARTARGDHARVAYLSLNRGEGGQNAIGPELFDALGVIRTEELLQARTLDGGGQFFTRAYDFGFSKTLAEASRMWDERRVLEDVVRIIRTFRPLVVYSIFSGTPADGHGHHQFSGKIAPEAFRAAADPAQFPDQIAAGLRPWQALKLYRGAGFGPGGPGMGPGATTVIETGTLDPVLGRTYAQIAAEGRDGHESQKMGVPEPYGSWQSGLVLLESKVQTTSSENSVFQGIDTSIPGLAALAGLPKEALHDDLSAIDAAVGKAVSGFDALHPARSVPALAQALTAIRAAHSHVPAVPGASEDARARADFLLGIKELDAERALVLASGTVVDALSEVETVNAGQSFRADVRVFLSEPSLVKIDDVLLEGPKGWRVETAAPRNPASDSWDPMQIRESADREQAFRITVPSDAPVTQPYWLKEPRNGWLYSWPPGAPHGEPFGPPLLHAEARAEIGGASVLVKEPLHYRRIDPVRGELRRNVEVVPAVSVAVDPPLVIEPRARLGEPLPVTVRLKSGSSDPVSGSARLTAPPDWKVSPPAIPFTLQAHGNATALVFTVTPPRGAADGAYSLRASALSEGRLFDMSQRTISYPHIQTHRIYAPAATQVRVLDLAVLPVTVGYIMGSGDQVPDALRRMGFPVTLLTDDELAAGDLGRYDTIVVGIRAAEARPGFVSANARFLQWVRDGGTLIVQYQQNGYEKLAPLPGTMASRVTDETAPVTILAPGDPAFTTPNRIGPSDFEGWVQERDLYAFTTFDPGYAPLLESHDPGEQVQKGGELSARLGKGRYVYTSYSWFRQLPAGVPGAYRLFANLVSLGARK